MRPIPSAPHQLNLLSMERLKQKLDEWSAAVTG